MKFKEVLTKTTTLGAEMVSAIYEMHGAQGCVIEDKADRLEGDWDYIDESVVQGTSDDVIVKAYFDVNANSTVEKIKEGISSFKKIDDIDLGSLEVIVTTVDDQDWKNEWKKYYKPFTVGEKILVRPYWEDEVEGAPFQIALDPGMAFGNGTHETTYMCLEFIDRYIKGNEFVYDVGCGTGILAVGAVLLGANEAIAIDRDSVAVGVAMHNIELNNLEGKITTKHGDLLKDETRKADMIIANIIADVIIPFSTTAYDMIVEGGIFISSGIIKERGDETIEAIKTAGFEVLDINRKGEWISVAAVKR